MQLLKGTWESFGKGENDEFVIFAKYVGRHQDVPDDGFWPRESLKESNLIGFYGSTDPAKYSSAVGIRLEILLREMARETGGESTGFFGTYPAFLPLPGGIERVCEEMPLVIYTGMYGVFSHCSESLMGASGFCRNREMKELTGAEMELFDIVFDGEEGVRRSLYRGFLPELAMASITGEKQSFSEAKERMTRYLRTYGSGETALYADTIEEICETIKANGSTQRYQLNYLLADKMLAIRNQDYEEAGKLEQTIRQLKNELR